MVSALEEVHMRSLCVIASLALVLGCKSKQDAPPAGAAGSAGGGSGSSAAVREGSGQAAGSAAAPVKKTLYDRLGGGAAVTAVVDEFVNRTTTDPRIKQRFFNTDAEALKKYLVEFVCQATGGGCAYTGRDMPTSHAGMQLVDDEFTALVENLKAALDKFKVGDTEQNELLGALAGLKDQIVVRPDALRPIDAARLEAVTKLAEKIKDKDPAAAELLALAAVAGKRGQRSYAEQLFTRAELLIGPPSVASVAATFREGAPPRVTSALKTAAKDAPAQPKLGASSDDEDALVPDPGRGALRGVLRLDGKATTSFGVVMLAPKSGAFPKRVAKRRVIEQRAKIFAPQVMAVPVGSTVEFPNFDPIYHNVFSLSRTRPFDLGMYKNGELREVVFDKPGVVRLGCNIHANMSAYLIVVDAPHYAVVAEDGKFAFRSLAPGAYRVRAWTEQTGEPTESELEVKAGQNEVTIELKASAAPGLGPDKFGGSRAQTTARTP
jgi:hemoglobin